MNHPAELALHQYMENAANGKSTMSEATIKQVADDVVEALQRQFGGGNQRDKFSLRMSNIGRPACQLWFEKNEPEKALPRPTTFVMNMMLGDIVEAVFKGLLKEAGITYEDADKVKLDIDENTSISGTGSKQRSNLLSATFCAVSLIWDSSLSMSRPVAGTYLNSPFALFTTHHPPTRLPDALA